MLGIKHLAREFDLDPYDIRMALRASPDIKRKKGQQWKWLDSNDPGYKVAQSITQKLKSKKLGPS